MKEYSGENLFLGCIENYHESVVGKIGRLYNNNYFSMFLQINKDSYFDLSNNKLYAKEESLQIKKLKKLNASKNFNEKMLKKVLKMQLKTL